MVGARQLGKALSEEKAFAPNCLARCEQLGEAVGSEGCLAVPTHYPTATPLQNTIASSKWQVTCHLLLATCNLLLLPHHMVNPIFKLL